MTRPFLFLILFLLTSKAVQSQTYDDWRLADSLLRVGNQLANEQDSLLKKKLDTNLITSGIPNNFEIKSYVLHGRVLDKNTNEGVPFATVFFPGTGSGTAADLDGNFELKVDALPVDTLYFQSVGYATFQQPLDKNQADQIFEIELFREATSLGEFVFRGGEDPALLLLKKIIRHKPKNNYDRLPAYRYEAYNKLEVDLVHLSKKQFEQLPIPMLKKFSFIYNNVDSSEQTPFLPFYLTETISDYYYQRNPKKTREFILASQVKGISNESITRYLGAMQQQFNVYENFLLVFDKNFISPIADNAPFYYKYKITDTQTVYGREMYQVTFHPRRKGENCFYGDFWVADSIFALQRITLELPKEANINFVNRVSLYQEFEPLNDSVWFLVKDKFISDFTLPYGSKLPGFIGRKTTTYRDVHFGDSLNYAILGDPHFKENVIVADKAREQNEDYWTTHRHEVLNQNEQAIYGMLDTLESLPSFQRFRSFMKFVVTGNLEAGPLEIGPYYYLYSRNPVEGNRFRFTLGTTPKLFKNAYLNGYLAYGDKDRQFKYQLSALWLLNRSPRTYLYAQHTHDINRRPGNDAQISDDNIFSRLARKPGIPYKLAMEDISRFEFFKEYHSGFSHQLYAQYRRFQPYSPLPSVGIFLKDGSPADAMISNEAGIKLRYAWREDFVAGNYYRYSLGSRYPVIELTAGAGFKDVLKSGYDYQRLVLTISDEAKIATFGKLYYAVFGGKVFGTLPYPLLEVHRGNEYYYYNKTAFSMMNEYEFISDQWAGFFLEHNIGSGLFNYIPLLKKAKLRQFWTAKGIIGSLSPANESLNLNKGFPFRTLAGNPYLELGTGISNILQVFRVDFVWRVTPRPLPEEKKESYFGVFGSMQFNF